MNQPKLIDSGDFQDNGLAQPPSRLWTVIRFLWLFPLIGFGGAFVGFFLWFAASVILGEAWCRDHWFLLLITAFVIAARSIMKDGGFGSGPLDFRGMMNSPRPDIGGHIATYFRSMFVWAYAAYALLFWFILAVAVWAWQSGAWQRAMGG
jgi:hypothetical protein